MDIQEFINILCQTDSTGGLKLKCDATGNDLSDILTTSDPVWGRRVKVDVSGITSVIESPFNPIDSPISIGDTYQQAFEKAQGQIDAIDTIINGLVSSVGATAPITSSGGTTPTISTSMNTNKLIGRSSAGVGVMEEISVGTGLAINAGTLEATGGGLKSGVAAGTDTYTVTITGVTGYADGDAYLIRFTNGNTAAAPTLNINGLGAVTLYRNNDGQLLGGDISANGEMLCAYDGSLSVFKCIGTSPNSLFAYVTNGDSVTITKGQPVYAFSGTGDRMIVKLAYNTSDSTSARTIGVVYSSSIAANQKGFIIVEGLLDGLSTLPTPTWTDGAIVYLGATAGTITPTKPYAPNHMVYIGTVTTASPGSAGRMYVKVQNGYELDEIHDVDLVSVAPVNNNVLTYITGTNNLWKPRSIATILGYTPANASGTTNQIAYFTGSTTLASLTTATYPSLTELSYLKGATSSIQTQINGIDDDYLLVYSFRSTYNY